MQEHNAIITRTELSSADHGLISAWLYLDYGGSGQGVAGEIRLHARDLPGFIWRVLEIAGVTEWAQLKGRTIRVRSEHTKVHAIGHIVKDDWFYPSDDFEAMDTP